MTTEVAILVALHSNRDPMVVQQALKDAGMKVTEVLRHAGMVTGSAFPASLPTIKAIPGVLHVETSRAVKALA